MTFQLEFDKGNNSKKFKVEEICDSMSMPNSQKLAIYQVFII